MPPAPILLTPGPTPVPPFVTEAMAQPLPHHRTPAFKRIYGETIDRMRTVFGTAGEPMLLTASGTGGFESVYANLVAPGDRVLCVVAGSFGERWARMAEAFGAQVERLEVAWGERPDPAAVAAAILRDPQPVLVTVVHSETSTGAVADVQAIAEATRGRSALLAVDAVSSAAAYPIELDSWGLDAVVTGSQKALMCPPGMAFVAASERALARGRELGTPRFYWDWERTLTAQRDGPQSPFTPAIPLVLGLHAALGAILDEGIDAIQRRVVEIGAHVRGRVRELGLDLFSPDDPSCSLVTAIRVPDGVDGDAVRGAVRDRHGIVLAGGQGTLVGKIWRMGQFGAITRGDLDRGLDALAQELGR